MITSFRSKFVPAITGLILIDCWDYSSTPDIHALKKNQVKHFYQNLATNIKRFPIKYVIDATTQLDQNQIDTYIDQEILQQIPSRHLPHWDDFAKYCTQDPDVNQWYVAGQTWNMCVHWNDIGLHSMANRAGNGQAFYADRWSFLKNSCDPVLHEDFEKDQTCHWEYLKWFGYKLL
jgi:hypothetical protein